MATETRRFSERFDSLGHETMTAAFQATAERVPDRPALRSLDGSTTLTWGEYAARVRAVAAGLAGLGLGLGETLAIMLTNRPEFHVVDAAAMHLGATPFSIFNTSSPEQIAFLVEDAAPRVAVTEAALAAGLLEIAAGESSLETVVVVDGEAPPGAITLEQLVAGGAPDFDFDAAWRAVGPGDLINLIYTSGTTGNPKGVQLTHANVVETVRAYAEIFAFPDGGAIVSYLPMAHIAERNVSQYVPMAFGYEVTSVPDPRRLIEALPQVHPVWFFAVPRVWEKMKSALEAGIGRIEGEAGEGVRAALAASLRRVELIQAGEPVPAELEAQFAAADEAIFAGMRAQVGLDRLELCNVGAAPTPPSVIAFFHAIGIPLSELWGMSETGGGSTCNPPGQIKIGTVGPPVRGVEIELAEDGEIKVRGPHVMAGYRNQPEKTAETIDADGWLSTGDIGVLDEDGYLKIVDRKKELIINAAGKNMSPANIESFLRSSGPLIGQAVAIGDRRPYNVALFTLDPESLPGFLEREGVDADAADLPSLAADARVLAAVQAEVDEANTHLANPERIRKFAIVPAEWQPGGEELTPTMKLKRKPIGEKYAGLVEALYAE